MKQYQDLLKHILKNGVKKSDRTGTGVISTFGYQMRFNLEGGFPLVTTKKVHIKSIIHELLWFLNGDTNTKYLTDNGVRIWNEWADANGDLGPVYGKQWRSWRTLDGQVIDQISDVINQLKTNPDSRRMIVSAWNVGELTKMALMPCHCFFQFYIASYALLTQMIAQVCDLDVGDFVHTFGDVHIYSNHLEQVELQLSREPRALPQMLINREVNNIFDFKYEDFTLINYDPHPAIKGLVAV